MRDFYYNQELLSDIISDESLVLCASLGSGNQKVSNSIYLLLKE